MIEEDDKAPIEFEIKLKKKFNNTDFLHKKIFLNEKQKKSYKYVKNLSDFGVAKSNFVYELKTGKGSLIDAFDKENKAEENKLTTKDENLIDFVGANIVHNAILQSYFFTLSNLLKYLPNLKSIDDFIHKDEYLKQFNIDIHGEENAIDNISVKEKLSITLSFLEVLENEMKNNIIQYEGSKVFKPYKFNKIFTNKTLLVPKDKEKGIIVNSDDWFAFQEFYGTTEEEYLIELIGKMIDDIKTKYNEDEIYLIRNERHFKIYNFEDGRAFEPDFVLFTQNTEDNLHFQIFIEPKGDHLKLKDKWKEDFLSEIKDKVKGSIIEFENERYKILGLKFYEKANENEFKEQLLEELAIK